jgi:predicted nucleic acid-binding Zn ribbon protein
MPIYNFRDNETGEETEILLKISELDEYKEKNPHLTQFLTGAPGIARGVGGFKNDNGWNENLSRIAEAHPTSALAEKVGGRKAKDLKTQEVIKKRTGDKILKGSTNYGLDKVK